MNYTSLLGVSTTGIVFIALGGVMKTRDRIFQLLHFFVHFVKQAIALFGAAGQETKVIFVGLDFILLYFITADQSVPFFCQ